MDNYYVVFDILSSGYKAWLFPAVGLFFIVMGVFAVIFRHKIFPPDVKATKSNRLFPFMFLSFGILWTIDAFYSTYSEYLYLIDSVKKGYVEIVEGSVNNFEPMPLGGHKKEKFCVQNTCFQYSDFNVTNGFNNATVNGGPIKEGLLVRVSYVGDVIVKLEILK